MRTPVRSVRSLSITLSLVIASLALLWLVAVPGTLTPLSYWFLATLFTALTIVALITYQNAQAPSSMAQLIHEADVAPSAATRDVRGAGTQARPLV